MQKINIQISKTGEIEYSVQGVTGKKCKDLTKAIDEISGKILETKLTAEYQQHETIGQTAQTKG